MELYGNILAYPVVFVFVLLTFINEIRVFDEETLVFDAAFTVRIQGPFT